MYSAVASGLLPASLQQLASAAMTLELSSEESPNVVSHSALALRNVASDASRFLYFISSLPSSTKARTAPTAAGFLGPSPSAVDSLDAAAVPGAESARRRKLENAFKINDGDSLDAAAVPGAESAGVKKAFC